jgi:hypothetical protein
MFFGRSPVGEAAGGVPWFVWSVIAEHAFLDGWSGTSGDA